MTVLHTLALHVPHQLALPIAAFSIFVLVKVFAAIFRSLHHRRLSKEYGCLPLQSYPNNPWGIRVWIEVIKAAKKNRVVELVAGRYYPGFYTFRSRMLATPHLHTIEPENIKTILATNFKHYSLGKSRLVNFKDLLGEGIFTLDGAGWEHSRGLLRPQFSRNQVSDIESFETHVTHFLALLPSGEGEVVDLAPIFFRLTLDSATEFLFGETAGSLLNGDSAFAIAFDEAQQWILWKDRFNFLTRWGYLPSRMKRMNATCHAFVDHYVDLALHPEKKSPDELGKQKYIFLDAIAESTQDPKVLRDQMLNVLLAGRDTTAGLLGWTFYLLSRHPRVFNKLRSDLEAKFGTDEPGVWKRPTFEELKDVTYLRYVLDEVLRLYPSVPLNGRTSEQDTVLPVGGGPDGLGPVLVPKGVRVLYSVYALHRRTDIYGEDALEFRPERWGEGKSIGRGWDYLPFNGGPRICLGRGFFLFFFLVLFLAILQQC
jgi:cytochrome P450